MFTINDVACRLNVSPSAVYAMVESGLLECHRIRCRPGTRGTIRVSEEQLASYLERSKTLGEESSSPRSATPRPGGFRHLNAERLSEAWKKQGAV